MIDPMFGLREGMEKKRKRREMIDPNFQGKNQSLSFFFKNNPIFCPISQTNQENAPFFKLDFLKIVFQKRGIFLISLEKNRVSKESHFPNQFVRWDKMLDFFFFFEMDICPFSPNFQINILKILFLDYILSLCFQDTSNLILIEYLFNLIHTLIF